MKASLTVTAEKLTVDVVADRLLSGELRNSRAETSKVFDLEVLISRVEEGETRARAANLPLPDSQAETVREALQMVIEQARGVINQSLASGRQIPRVDPPAAPEENESRFVVPLVVQ